MRAWAIQHGPVSSGSSSPQKWKSSVSGSPFGRLQLIQLNEHTCKWPNGDPLSEDFHFCGNDFRRDRTLLQLPFAHRVPAGVRAAASR